MRRPEMVQPEILDPPSGPEATEAGAALETTGAQGVFALRADVLDSAELDPGRIQAGDLESSTDVALGRAADRAERDAARHFPDFPHGFISFAAPVAASRRL